MSRSRSIRTAGVNVMYRDYNHGRFMFDGSVIAFGQSGNDSIPRSPSLSNTAMLFGQAGDDSGRWRRR